MRDAAVARAAAADRARAGYDRDYATVARLGKAVPENADVPSLVYQLETAARAREGRLPRRQRARHDPGAADGGAAATARRRHPADPVLFKFEGSFFGLQKLLSRVDRFSRVKGTQIAVNGRLLTIDGVTLNPGRDGLPQIQGLVTARAYVADLPDVLPGSATAASGDASPSTTVPASEVTTP